MQHPDFAVLTVSVDKDVAQAFGLAGLGPLWDQVERAVDRR